MLKCSVLGAALSLVWMFIDSDGDGELCLSYGRVFELPQV